MKHGLWTAILVFRLLLWLVGEKCLRMFSGWFRITQFVAMGFVHVTGRHVYRMLDCEMQPKAVADVSALSEKEQS
jgi:hypothetical protein